MALIPICHTPRPGYGGNVQGLGDVIQVSQHIHRIVQQALTFNKKGKYITCLKRTKVLFDNNKIKR